MTGGSRPDLPAGWWDAQRPVDLAPLLGHRRWWWHRSPFPHVRAVNVFRPDVYAELEEAFTGWLAASSGGSELAGHDLQGTTVTPRFEGPLRVFASLGWQRMLARMFDTSVTPHVNLGLHHHRPGGLPGFAHTDLNPGWFPDVEPDPGSGTVLADPGVVEYTTGEVRDPGVRPVRVVRAVAMLFYLANPVWESEHGGETGLYLRPHGDMADPVASVAPHSNSLLVFECTPWSFHGFQGGGNAPRNSVVGWLHRPAEDAVQRWGHGSIIGYGKGMG